MPFLSRRTPPIRRYRPPLNVVFSTPPLNRRFTYNIRGRPSSASSIKNLTPVFAAIAEKSPQVAAKFARASAEEFDEGENEFLYSRVEYFDDPPPVEQTVINDSFESIIDQVTETESVIQAQKNQYDRANGKIDHESRGGRNKIEDFKENQPAESRKLPEKIIQEENLPGFRSIFEESFQYGAVCDRNEIDGENAQKFDRDVREIDGENDRESICDRNVIDGSQDIVEDIDKYAIGRYRPEIDKKMLGEIHSMDSNGFIGDEYLLAQPYPPSDQERENFDIDRDIRDEKVDEFSVNWNIDPYFRAEQPLDSKKNFDEDFDSEPRNLNFAPAENSESRNESDSKSVDQSNSISIDQGNSKSIDQCRKIKSIDNPTDLSNFDTSGSRKIDFIEKNNAAASIQYRFVGCGVMIPPKCQPGYDLNISLHRAAEKRRRSLNGAQDASFSSAFS